MSEGVKFIRVRGRVVPIRDKNAPKKRRTVYTQQEVDGAGTRFVKGAKAVGKGGAILGAVAGAVHGAQNASHGLKFAAASVLTNAAHFALIGGALGGVTNALFGFSTSDTKNKFLKKGNRMVPYTKKRKTGV